MRPTALCALAFTVGAASLPAQAARDTVVTWTAADGTPLTAKLSLPAGAGDRVPVVFYLHGAGPRNTDHAVRYRDSTGQVRTVNYYDYYSRELGRLGVAFFRMAKRGVTADSTGRTVADRAVFSKATPSVLLDDYASALEVMRRLSAIDPARIVLMGSSEGTRLAPQLARRSPAGIVGLVLESYAADNQHNTVVWQNTVGPWRNIRRLFGAGDDGRITRAQYDTAVARLPALATRVPFAALDTDRDGVMTDTELAALNAGRLALILKAVETGDDDFLWTNLLNLSSAYLRDGWDAEPTSAMLLRLTLPVGIFHGDLDATTRVEGVHETEAAFKAAGRTDLTVRVYPGADHDLLWTPLSAAGRGPEPYQDAFRFAARLLGREPGGP